MRQKRYRSVFIRLDGKAYTGSATPAGMCPAQAVHRVAIEAVRKRIGEMEAKAE
jgi:hypothetical protein